MEIKFDVYGFPVAQGRPRFTIRKGIVIAYDPVKSKNWKTNVREQAILNKANKLLLNALSMKLIFRLPRPKSLSKKIKFHVKKPDLDNLIKSIKDALRGICYHDDSQIVEIHAKKSYDNESPGVSIIINSLSDE